MTFDEVDSESVVRGPDPGRLAGIRAASAWPGPRDDDGQPVVSDRTADVRIVCACDYRGGSCGRNLGGIWQTEHGPLIVLNDVTPEAKDWVQAFKNSRLGGSQVAPRPGDRLPDHALTDQRFVLLDGAVVVTVSCVRHGRWTLDLREVEHKLMIRRATMRRQKMATRP
jgi:hypothetical protein